MTIQDLFNHVWEMGMRSTDHLDVRIGDDDVPIVDVIETESEDGSQTFITLLIDPGDGDDEDERDFTLMEEGAA